ncbi:hypothetical protein [Pseudomonas sp. P108]|uniref:hypothetical protein n=1 Tax=Pseudomonas sp. P108 TaxID=1837993 RepID=UPI0029341608|nr:hypothetical protein [Pseudomonas sp. P108]WNZ87595.1 hypothetical protein QOM10_30375 [Pseudomonas sp. P108]
MIKAKQYAPDDPELMGRPVILASDYELLRKQLEAAEPLAREVEQLRALSTVFDNDAALTERMKAAGMMTAAEMMAGSPLDVFMRHAGVRDLDTFSQWLSMRREESVKLHARLVLEGREEDELFDWVLSHSAAFGEVLANFKAAVASERNSAADPGVG